MFCHFGALSQPVEGRHVDTGIIACRAPAFDAVFPGSKEIAQTVQVKVSKNGHSFSDASAALPLIYQPAISATRVGSPSSAPTVGGTLISVIGNGFDNTTSLACHFGEERAEATFVSASELTCMAPAMASAGAVPLYVSNNGVERVLAGAVDYFEHPMVEGLSPSLGKASALVRVLGSGFRNTTSLACRFNDNLTVQGTYVDSTAIQCETPAAVAGGEVKENHIVHAVKVTLNGVDYSSRIVYYLAHNVSSQVAAVYPSSGSIDGGTIVTVQGSGFPQTAELYCRIGSVEEVKATWLSNSAVQCTTPPGKALGVVKVILTSNGVNVVPQQELSFVYTSSAYIESFAPTSGCACGGLSIVVSGAGFSAGGTNGVFCRFGSQVVSGEYVNETRINCQAPVANTGSTLVELSFNDGYDFVASAGRFEFTEQPQVSFKGPRVGTVAGGTKVSFAVAPHQFEFWCSFGSAASVLAVRTEGTDLIACTSPSSSSAGTTTIRLHTNGMDMFEYIDRFTYTEVPTLTAVSPSFATTEGGSSIVVTGNNFFAKMNATVLFGLSVAPEPCVVLTRSAIRCLTPSHSPGSVDISLSFNGQDFVSAVGLFTFRPPSSIVSLSVSHGPIQGGSKLTILGSNFVNASTLVAKFGKELSPATFLNSTAIEVRVPPQQQTGEVGVVVSANGVDFTDASTDAAYTYTSRVSISGVYPSYGPKEVTSAVTILGNGFSIEHNLKCGLYVEGVRRAQTPVSVVNASALICDILPSASLGKLRGIMHAHKGWYYFLSQKADTDRYLSLSPCSFLSTRQRCEHQNHSRTRRSSCDLPKRLIYVCRCVCRK